jgi:Spy/CpxP family protein refolding chaperone
VASAAPAPSSGVAAEQTARPSDTTSDTTNKEDEEIGAELVEHHRHHHHGGVALFLALSLDSLGVSAEQQAQIEKIRDTLRAKLEPAQAAEKKVALLLADEIAAGKVDQPKVDAAIGRLGAASGAVHPAVVDALVQLHGVLDETQRTALVDKVEAHWELWKDANGVGVDPAERREHGRLETLAIELSLTPEQVDSIRKRLQTAPAEIGGRLDAEKVEAHLKALGAAFEAPTFDAKSVGPNDGVNARLTNWGASRMARFYAAVTPVLTPDQRTKLAERVREHANHSPEA